jgi:sugar phosphate permease
MAKRMAFFYIVGLVFGGCGGLIAYGLQTMDGAGGLGGWRWIFIWEGIFTITLAIAGYFLLADFPEDAHKSWKFLKPSELEIVINRVEQDRGDAHVTPFNLKSYLMEARDWKLWAFAINFLAVALVTYSVQYFLPIILQSGLGFNRTLSMCLTAPVRLVSTSLSLFLFFPLILDYRFTSSLASSL